MNTKRTKKTISNMTEIASAMETKEPDASVEVAAELPNVPEGWDKVGTSVNETEAVPFELADKAEGAAEVKEPDTGLHREIHDMGESEVLEPSQEQAAALAKVEQSYQDGLITEAERDMKKADILQWVSEVRDNMSFDQIKSLLEAGDIDESILLDHVTDGNLTPAQFTELTGKEYVGVDDTSDFQNIKMEIEKRLGEGKLNASGAAFYVEDLLRKEKVTPDEAKNLRDWLRSSNTLPHNPVREAIEQFYHPTYSTLEEIKIAGSTAAKDMISAAVEIETSKQARITGILADFAYLKMLGNLLPVSSSIADELWKLAKEDMILGDPNAGITKDDNGAIIGITDPYNDPAIRPQVKVMCMKACLLAYGSVTRVEFGYIRKEHARGGRLNARMVFERTNGDDNAFLRAVCVPSNVISPYSYTVKSDREVITDKSGKKVEATVKTLVTGDERKDDTLRYCSNEVAAALYGHYFKGETLEYDLRSESDKTPSGMLIGSYKPRTPTDATEAPADGDPASRETGGSQDQQKSDKDTITDQKREIAELRQTLEAANKGNVDDVLSMLNPLQAVIRDASQPFPPTAQANLLKAVVDLIDRRLLVTTQQPDPAVVGLLCMVSERAEKLVSFDYNDGDWTCEPNGGVPVKYQVDMQTGNAKSKYAVRKVA